MRKMRIGDFLKRSKIPIDIKDKNEYKRVKIRIRHNGVSLRDKVFGVKIGTKKQFILKSGQFILSKIDARYGAFGIAPMEVDGSIITGNFWAYDVDNKIINIEWFNQFTNSPFFYNLCERASSGITHRKYLDETFFLNYEIFLPDINAQAKQIEIIKDLKLSFSLSNKELNTQLNLVKQLRQSFLREAMQGKLIKQNPNDEPASVLLENIKQEKEKLIEEGKLKKEKPLPPIKPEEIPYPIPKSWTWCRMGDACSINPRNKLDDNLDVAFIPMALISEKYGVNPRYEIKKWKDIKTGFTHFANNDVIVAKITPCFENSKAGIIRNLPNGYGAGSTELNVIRTYKLTESDFIYALIKNPLFLKNGEKIMRGVSGQQRVPTDYFYNSVFPLPPLAEQKRIVEKLDKLMKLCDDLENSIAESKKYNEQLLQQVLKEALNN